MNYLEVIDDYVDVRPDYEELTKMVHDELDALLTDACIRHWCSSRTKDVSSYVKTAVKRGYANPLLEIKDKSGVRVLIPFEDLEQVVAEQIRKNFTVHNEDNKREKLAVDQFGYNALHLEVSLKESNDAPIDERLKDLRCEIQIHTLALHAWSEVSHDLIYKPTGYVDNEYLRRMNRLIALAEVFDAEVTRTRRELESEANYREAWMLRIAEELYWPIAKTEFDRELSLVAMGVLATAYSGEEKQEFERLINDEISARTSELRAIYEQHSEVKWMNPFLFQPEALVIYERLRAKPQRLKSVWDAGPLPMKVLEDLAATFGEPL